MYLTLLALFTLILPFAPHEQLNVVPKCHDAQSRENNDARDRGVSTLNDTRDNTRRAMMLVICAASWARIHFGVFPLTCCPLHAPRCLGSS